MSLLDWSDDFSVYSKEMDNQHKGLINIMNELYQAANDKLGKPQVLVIFDKLTKAVLAHFADEEKHMEAMGYPELETHKRIHADLVNKYVKYVEEYKNGDGNVNGQVFMFLKMWLAAHINGIDKKYGYYQDKKSA